MKHQKAQSINKTKHNRGLREQIELLKIANKRIVQLTLVYRRTCFDEAAPMTSG